MLEDNIVLREEIVKTYGLEHCQHIKLEFSLPQNGLSSKQQCWQLRFVEQIAIVSIVLFFSIF
jgi:hypothetical protein